MQSGIRAAYSFARSRSQPLVASGLGHNRLVAFSRFLCSSSPQQYKSVRILFGSQTGTAQLFAVELADAVGEAGVTEDVSVSAINEARSPEEVAISSPDVANIFITSVTGVGEPPENARDFYNWLSTDDANLGGDVRYAVFGCGNLVAHPNNYNVIGKHIDQRMEELGGERIHELGLGDDSDCIEDDFDNWTSRLIESLSSGADANEANESDESAQKKNSDTLNADAGAVGRPSSAEGSTNDSVDHLHRLEGCEGSNTEDGKRRISSTYPRLKLTCVNDGSRDLPRPDIFFRDNMSFYQPDTRRMPIISNRALRSTAGEYIMHEMIVSIEDFPGLSYEAGDHLIVYPRNAQCTTDAYLDILDVQGSAIIEEVQAQPHDGKNRIYPHPQGITVEETLMYSCDLGAPPSPSFSRKLLGRKELNYKKEVAEPRRTVIELIKESGLPISLEELLFNLPPMQPRYYSIASSPLVNPQNIYLTYRPVKYITSRGSLREGLCSSYLKNMHEITEDSTATPHIAAAVKANPTFRLPKDDSTPILLVAGGCGIAPIRAFVEERMARVARMEESNGSLGETYLYLGFRSPADEVYRGYFRKALEAGAITEAHISYTKGCTSPDQNCRFVSDTLRKNGKFVIDFLGSGGHVYLCGGARQFGAAMERALLEILQEHKDLSIDEAEDFLRKMLREGRLSEDLAD